DPVSGKEKLHEVYTHAQPDYTGRASVPVLWDRQTGAIVSNESLDISQDLDSAFGAWADPSVRLFPENRMPEIRAMIDANYKAIQNNVYHCDFAASQNAY